MPLTRSLQTPRHRIKFCVASLTFGILASGISALTAQPAYAAQDAWSCSADNIFIGTSNKKGKATTSEATGSECGSVKVQVMYQIVAGGTVYYSGWYTASSIVSHKSGNIGYGGKHSVTSCTLVYTCGPESTYT